MEDYIMAKKVTENGYDTIFCAIFGTSKSYESKRIFFEQKNTQMNRFSFWVISHFRAFFYGLGELIRHPFASLMTLLVIAIAIAGIDFL